MTCRIFIVEDDPTLQKLYQWVLKNAGHTVIGTANDGVEAVDMFRAFLEKPDIIIMDHRMPNKEGIETSREILKMCRRTKIIFASADISVKKVAIELGVESFLSKPFEISLLLQEIKRITTAKNRY